MDASGVAAEQGFCKACGTPAGAVKLCQPCSQVFPQAEGGLIHGQRVGQREINEGHPTSTARVDG